MISLFRTVYLFFTNFRFLFIIAGVTRKDNKLHMDVERWGEIYGIEGPFNLVLATLLSTKKEFRNLFIYRNRYRRIYRWWIKIWYKPIDTLFIETEQIGGGLFIQHGFSTIIAAESIGENCWINQQVTIGYSGKERPPIIGNNVMITCGAKVLGPITIGDNAIIGANAVEIKDVEKGAVMGGVPAVRFK